MSQIRTKWIEDGAITPAKLLNSGDFFVHGLDTTDMTVHSDFTVDGTAVINGDLSLPYAETITASGAALSVNSLVTFSDANIQGALDIGSDASVSGGNFYVDGTALINGNLELPNADILTASGLALSVNTLTTFSDTYVQGNLDVSVDATVGSNLQVDGTALINGNLELPNADILTASGLALSVNTLTTFSDTYVQGGLDVSTDASVSGGNLYVDGTALINGNLELPNADILTASGLALSVNTLTTFSDTYVQGNLDVSIDATVGSNLQVDGTALLNDLSIIGDIFAGGFGGDTTSVLIGGTTLNFTKGILTSVT